MSKKLTLNITNEDLIEKAKDYAKSQGQSLSHIIQNYLMTLADLNKKPMKKKNKIPKLTGKLAKMKGIIKLPPGYDYDQAKYEYFKDKYGL